MKKIIFTYLILFSAFISAGNTIQEIKDLKVGKVNLSFIMELNNSDTPNLGFALCADGAKDLLACQEALNGDNAGFGICMGAGRSYSECAISLSGRNIGFGICMAAGQAAFLCGEALGDDNIGLGLCLMKNDMSNCSKAKGREAIAFGLCMHSNPKSDGLCGQALN
jgi:hypothetical protein